MSNEGQGKNLSIVIPVYKGSASLPELCERLVHVLDESFETSEILLVNDGSPDNSWAVIQELAGRYAPVRGINLMRNYGQHNATLCGLREARFPITVTMDDDLQHPPEEIPKLIEKLGQGFDVVYGSPETPPHSFMRNLCSKGIKRLYSFVMRVKNVKEISAFRAFKTELRKACGQYGSSEVIIDVLLSWGTTKFSFVKVREDPRKHGDTGYTVPVLLRQAILVLIGFSTVPLRVASWVGFAFTLFGIGVFVYVLWVYFYLGSIPGFSFQASIIAIFSGCQLFALGILGEYLARVFERSMDRPTYVIGETTGKDS